MVQYLVEVVEVEGDDEQLIVVHLVTVFEVVEVGGDDEAEFSEVVTHVVVLILDEMVLYEHFLQVEFEVLGEVMAVPIRELAVRVELHDNPE